MKKSGNISKSLLAGAERFKRSIGTKNESTLHKTLKFKYTGVGGKTEIEVGDYVTDGISEDGEYIEVQTNSFGPLRKKVKELAANSRVRIIHPIAVSKTVEVYDTDRKFLRKRKSPVHGSSWDLFNALLYAPELPLLKNVIIEIVMVDITEKRINDGKGSRRRKGISIFDKEISVWHESVVFTKKNDYLRFIPFKKKEEFTVSSFAKQTGIKICMARKVLYVLTKMKLVKRIGKKGNTIVYVR